MALTNDEGKGKLTVAPARNALFFLYPPMISKRTPIFGKDLRYLSRATSARARTLGRPSHWVATLVIAVAVAVWLGRSPDAAVERSSEALRVQVASVLAQDPLPLPEPALKTGVNLLPPIQGMKGIDALPLAAGPGASTERATPDKIQAIDPGTNPITAATPVTLTATPDATPGLEDSTPAPVSSPNLPAWEHVEIVSGDSLVRIFKRLDLDTAQAIVISKVSGAKALRYLRPGPYLKIRRDGADLLALQYQPDIRTYLKISAKDNAFQASTIERVFDIQQREVTVEITDSLYQSARRSGLPDSVIFRLAHIFQWQIDFSTDIRRGDRLAVIYEERSLDGEKVGNGPILASTLAVDGNLHHAIRHVFADGSAGYFAPDGKSLQRAFLRAPVSAPRITSNFSYKRLHPILKIRRPHLGVDYGAPRGTPVMATGEGKVIRASRKGGYGKTIIIRHGQRYRTLYGHLSGYAKGIRKGKWVKKGQVIGYVGTTGLSTGPHLHYEFHVDGKARNPRKVQIPRAASINSKEKSAFLKQVSGWLARLEQVRQT